MKLRAFFKLLVLFVSGLVGSASDFFEYLPNEVLEAGVKSVRNTFVSVVAVTLSTCQLV